MGEGCWIGGGENGSRVANEWEKERVWMRDGGREEDDGSGRAELDEEGEAEESAT